MWRLLSLNNYVAASAVNAALRSRLAAWKGELRGAIAAADAALVCKLFLEFLGGLVQGHLRSSAEKECVTTALDKLRGGGTRAASAHHLAAGDLGLLVDRCWSEFGARTRQRRETSSNKRRAPYLLEKRRQIHKRYEDAVDEWNTNWNRVRHSGGLEKVQGAVTLPTAPLLALEELRELRKRGVAALSLTTAQVTTALSTATTPHTPARPRLLPTPTHAHGLTLTRSPSTVSCSIGPTSSSCRTGRPRACFGSSSHCSAAPLCRSASRRTPSSASTPRCCRFATSCASASATQARQWAP